MFIIAAKVQYKATDENSFLTLSLPNPLANGYQVYPYHNHATDAALPASGDGCQYLNFRTDPNCSVCCFLSMIPFFWDTMLRHCVIRHCGLEGRSIRTSKVEKFSRSCLKNVGSNPVRGADVYEYFCLFLLSCFGRDLATGGPHAEGEVPDAYQQDSETRRAGELSATFGLCANTQIRALRVVCIQSIALAVSVCTCNHLFLFFSLFVLFSKTVR
jgi:hypothetical protein